MIWVETRYEGYFVNEIGEVKLWSGKVTRGHLHKSTGYLRITIRGRDRGTRQTPHVHVLICEAFHGPRPTIQHEAAHGNGDRQDNRASNLRWATKLENERDKVEHGNSLRGTKHPLSKLTAPMVVQMRSEYAMGGITQRQLARRYGIGQAQVSEIVRRRAWAWL